MRATAGSPGCPAAVSPRTRRCPTPPAGLAVRSFTRDVDLSWRRTSYSALTRAGGSEPAGVTSEPEVPERDDEVVQPVPTEDRPPAGGPPSEKLTEEAGASPMAALPAGTTFGSLVHAVLEHADPHAADLHAELTTIKREQLARWPVDVSPDALATALVTVHDAPLGPLAPGLTLRDVAAADRLR